MAEREENVYLEDIDAKYTTKRHRAEDNESSEASVTKSAPVATPPPPKRQRTIADMFIGKGAKSKVASPGMQKLNAIPFSLSAFQESLTEDQKRLLRLECEVLGKSWLKVLKDEIKKPYFQSLKEFLWREGFQGPDDTLPSVKIYPSARNIYNWSNTPLGKVKVVIIGQGKNFEHFLWVPSDNHRPDPYHGRGQAHGLCFSVPVGMRIPPSLQNIYTELKSEYPDFKKPQHGCLQNWAGTGVLMLNSVLTVREGVPNSHAEKGWEKFTDAVIEAVDKYGGANLLNGSSGEAATGFGRGVVFLAWGAYAAKRVAKLNKVKHLILTSPHPSPHSADKGFFGNDHFKLANEWLVDKYGEEGQVDWCNLDMSSLEEEQ